MSSVRRIHGASRNKLSPTVLQKRIADDGIDGIDRIDRIDRILSSSPISFDFAFHSRSAQVFGMQVTHLPEGFEAIPTYAQHEKIHNHPVLSPNGILAFRHITTGIRLVQFAAAGPLVSSTILVGTKPLSNAGHPHTLEHIIFLGSQKHPRGYLDNLACRSLAEGTNAWTDNEYTAYTTVTAGFDGLAHLLPAFLDHVLRPRINDAAFASEVYHVRADGKEAGVVFCEMQARENTEGDLSDNALRQALLPDTPLQYDSGGLCKDIRHLTNEEVFRFHYDQYCTANISVVVGGTVDSFALLSSVKPLFDEIAAVPGFSPRGQSWDSPLVLQPLPKVTRNIVPFPCPDQDIGTVIIGWRGPGTLERKKNMAIDVLMRYLAADVWSPLRQRFVETEEQLASDIYYSQDIMFDVSIVNFSFSGVHHLHDEEEQDENEHGDSEDEDEYGEDEDEDHSAMEKDHEVGNSESFLTSGAFERMVTGYLSELASADSLPGGIAAIRVALKKERETQLADMESGSHDTLPYDLIEELVYGNREGLTIGEEARGFLERYEALEKEEESYWIALLQEMFVDNPRAEILMVPDAALAKKLAEDEKRAVAERIQLLGKEQLEKIGRENEARIQSTKAQKFDSAEFPPIPSTMNISRWPYSLVRETGSEYASQSVTLDTDFVHCTIFLDTSEMTISQRVFLPILCELVPTCDIYMEDGTCIPYTDHSRALSEATISTAHSGIFLGYGRDLAHQCGVIHFAASPDSFEEAARLTLLSIFRAEITTERLSVIAQTLHADSTSDMRDGVAVMSAASALIPYLVSDGTWKGEVPNFVFANFLGSHPLVSYLTEEFTRKNPRMEVQRNIIRKLQECIDTVRSLPSSNIFVQVAARDPKPAHDTVKALWARNRAAFNSRIPNSTALQGSKGEGKLAITRRICGKLSELFAGRTVGRIIGIRGVESSCMNVRVDSPVYNGHADWSALIVLTEMLSRMEGPLSSAVRGAGLAYHVDIFNSWWRGHLAATISESASPAVAWDAVCKTLKEFRKALDRPMDSGLDVDLETAKAASLFVLNRGRSTPENIAIGAISQTALGVPASPLADRAQEEAVEKVTLTCVAGVFDRHVARLLEPANRLVTVTCGQSVLRETIAAFEKCSHPIKLTECSIDSLHISVVDDVVTSMKTPN